MDGPGEEQELAGMVVRYSKGCFVAAGVGAERGV